MAGKEEDAAGPERAPNAIEKALDILLAFTPYNQEMGTGELSEMLGLHKATTSRIVSTLSRRGFLQRNRHTKKYHLGPAAMSIAKALFNSLNTDMVLIARPFLEELRDRLGETVVFEVWSGDGTYIAHVAEGPQKVRIAGTVGDRLPAHAAAGAKAILAYSPRTVVEECLKKRLQRFTPRTITDHEELERELIRVRKRGFAVDFEEIDLGINAVAAPVFDHREKAVAAVVVAGPSPRVSGKSNSTAVRLVRETAAKVSARLQLKMEGGDWD